MNNYNIYKAQEEIQIAEMDTQANTEMKEYQTPIE